MDFSKIHLADHQQLARTIVLEAMQGTFKNRSDFQKFRNFYFCQGTCSSLENDRGWIIFIISLS